MTKKEPKSGKDFLRLARSSDKVKEIREGKGSHVVIKFKNNTSVSVPVHGNKQLKKGIYRKILKIFKTAGVIGIFLLLILKIFFLKFLNTDYADFTEI